MTSPEQLASDWLIALRRAIRAAGGVKEVSRLTGISENTVSRVQNGKPTRQSTILEVARAVGIPLPREVVRATRTPWLLFLEGLEALPRELLSEAERIVTMKRDLWTALEAADKLSSDIADLERRLTGSVESGRDGR